MSVNKCILSTAYLGPLSYYKALLKYDEIHIEQCEHFVKQTYRTRYNIYGANGLLKLIIPLVKHSEKTSVAELKIDYHTNWQNLHWKSIESAYRSSPYFEYYEYDFLPFYEEKQTENLIEFNRALLDLTCKLLKISPNIRHTSEYKKEYTDVDDLRNVIIPKNRQESSDQHYKQVFDDKHGFINDLSIIDLIFNLGPDASEYLIQKT